ncbi:TIR domain-containing protein [Bradyrhizobium zhanjiangense]|uniref:TIR domain-containing protein n=1 Tax=Bradyrhizobium zhanjiangense TaxID=1325107 RepID=UPI0013E8A239
MPLPSPSLISESRGKRAPTVRDNVLFELGLFMGKLSRYRTIRELVKRIGVRTFAIEEDR